MELNSDMIVVEKKSLEIVLDRLERLEKIINGTQAESIFRDRVNLMAKGGMLETNAICELMGWGRRTFTRRLNTGEIPVVQDGRKYKMSVDDFIKWHHKNYEL